jgi:hypothetical protein
LVYIGFRSVLLHGIAFKKKRFNNFLKEISYFLFILILFINKYIKYNKINDLYLLQ